MMNQMIIRVSQTDSLTVSLTVCHLSCSGHEDLRESPTPPSISGLAMQQGKAMKAGSALALVALAVVCTLFCTTDNDAELLKEGVELYAVKRADALPEVILSHF